ncbi:hypothetical protein [Microbacterium hydrocarbonoxydans]|uniref:hypothetical protein n=1 Tax=Microbacterium hydrocarbonoxydans TaxID=273678 RepID=UPI0013DCE551|nr:hypothetical protein [Microbacterium hydrocarbonoxydans]
MHTAEETTVGTTTEAGWSRRTVLRGAAWSVPVIAVAVATPLASASVAPSASVRIDGLPETVVIGADVSGAMVSTDGTDDVTVTLPEGFEWVDGGGTAGIPRVIGSGPGTVAVPPFRAVEPSSASTVVADVAGTTVAATVRAERAYALSLLGGTTAIGDGPDEFRADFCVIVPAGVRPTRLEYAFYPLTASGWTRLAPVADVQSSIGEAYGVAHVQDVGSGFERLWISARGDADVPNAPHGSHTWPVRATWPDGSRTQLDMPFTLVHFGDDGRPLAINAWDTVTARVPGYPGPNSQTGWGNVVPAGGATLSGDRFFVGAKTSGRSAAIGNDLTTEVLFQFVDESGRPASVTPTPRRLTVPNYVNDASGVYLGAVLGDFSLDHAGYWRLLVWPQTSSSAPGSAASPDGVAWNPALDQGHQVGSVFYRLPANG